MIEWSGTDLMESVDRIRRLCKEEGVRPADDRRSSTGSLVVDVVGLGSGVVDRLRELGFFVGAFNAGEGASDSVMYFNRRAESYWSLARKLEAGTVALPDDPSLHDELVATTWHPSPTGQVQLPPKDRIKAAIGRSPDRADAVSMAFAFEPIVIWERVYDYDEVGGFVL